MQRDKRGRFVKKAQGGTVLNEDSLIANGKKYKFGKRKHKVPFYRLPNQFLWGFTADFTHRFIEIISEDTDFLEGKNEK